SAGSCRRSWRDSSAPKAAVLDMIDLLKPPATWYRSLARWRGCVADRMRFHLPQSLLAKLRQLPRRDEIEEAHDAFIMDPGMGPVLYLTADGRVLVDGSGWDDEPLREATEEEAIAAIVIGAKKKGIPELLELLPRGANICSTCAGTHWAPLRGSEGSSFAVH